MAGSWFPSKYDGNSLHSKLVDDRDDSAAALVLDPPLPPLPPLPPPPPLDDYACNAQAVRSSQLASRDLLSQSKNHAVEGCSLHKMHGSSCSLADSESKTRPLHKMHGSSCSLADSEAKTPRRTGGDHKTPQRNRSARHARRSGGTSLQHASTDSNIQEHKQFESCFLTCLPPSALWFLPALVLFAGLYAQNAGLYWGTRCYVHWMDSLHRPVELEDGSGGNLTVPLVRSSLRNVVPLPSLTDASILSAFTHVVDLLTSGLFVAWLLCMLRTKDLRCWTLVLLSATLLTTLKGFLAWSTVAPDAEGWEACRQRLGEHGLKYYRRRAGNTLLEKDIDLAEMLYDILLLVVCGLFMPGEELRTHFCGDTMFSSTVGLCVIITLGLQEAVGRLTELLDPTMRLAVQTLVRSLLAFLLLCNIMLPVLHQYHYSADVLVALLLGHLVYGNPAISMAAQRWAAMAQDHAAAASNCCEARSVQATAAAATSHLEDSSFLDTSKRRKQDVRLPQEVGHVFLVPCCGLSTCFCHGEGAYYLREGPVTLPCAEVSGETRRGQLEYMRSIEEALLQSHRNREMNVAESLAETRTRAAKTAKEVKQEFERTLADQARRHSEEESRKAAELKSFGLSLASFS